MIRLALTPSCRPASAMRTAAGRRSRSRRRCRGGVALRVEEHLDVAHVVGMHALEIGPGEVVEILLGDAAPTCPDSRG